jgi:hypothetical protein
MSYGLFQMMKTPRIREVAMKPQQVVIWDIPHAINGDSRVLWKGNAMQILLIEYKPQKARKVTVDPYYIAGEQKRKLLEQLTDITYAFEKLENPDFIDKEDYYLACVYLEAEANRRVRQCNAAAHHYSEEKKRLAAIALEEFKVQAKLDFMTKYQDNIQKKSFTPDMMRELDKLEKRERVGCYAMNGLTITPRECSICSHKACNRTVKE